jgi:glycosyltransferase involved in cell wall biosynthesis
MYNDKLAVCMIISGYYPIVSGAENQCQLISERLKTQGIEVAILTRHYQGLEYLEEINSIPVYRIPTLGKGIVASITFTIFSILWLFRYGRRYDVFHCHQALSPTTIGVLGKILWRKKVITKIACTGDYGDISEMRRFPFLSLRKQILKKVDTFVSLNPLTERELTNLGLREFKLVDLPNGVDLKTFASVSESTKFNLRNKLGLSLRGSLVIFVGRLAPQKGIETLLYAWAEVLKKLGDKQNQLILLGKGQQEKYLYGLIKELDLNSTVTLLGWKDNALEYLQVSDIFVLPSISEGISNSLLEAMACGLTVVATDNPGNKLVIKNGENGLLVKIGDPQELSQAIISCLKGDLGVGLGEKARKVVEEKFSLRSVVKGYKDLYMKLTLSNHNIKV